jgi:hypothetical protein
VKSLVALESEDMDVHVCKARILTTGLCLFVNTAYVGFGEGKNKKLSIHLHTIINNIYTMILVL